MRTSILTLAVLSGLTVAAGAGSTIDTTAQEKRIVLVTVRPPTALDIVLVQGGSSITVLTTTDQNGTGSFDAAQVEKIGRLDLVEELCPQKSPRVLGVPEKSPLPESGDCRRRRVGSFWWGHDEALNVRLSRDGLSTGAKTGLFIGAAGAIGGGLVIANGGGGNSDGGNGGAVLTGLFNITATKTVDIGCNFVPSFTGQVELSPSSDGSRVTARMIERLTREYIGTRQTNGGFDAIGNGDVGGRLYSGRLVGQVTGNAVQGTETLNFSTGCPNGQVIYSFTGSK